MKNKTNSILSYLGKTEDRITNWNRKGSIKAINFGLVILVSFIGILLLNLAQPIFGDDWGYSLVSGNTNQRITNIGEIFSAQYAHYFYWGGRTVVHIIAQFLLMIDETWADIINSLAYVLLTLVIYRTAVSSKTLYPGILILINLMICFFQVAFGSTLLWITGSANYLWGTLIILLFLLPYVNEYRREKIADNDRSHIKAVLFLFFGIIAGWTNENMAVALIAMLAGFIFIYKQQGKSIPKWATLGLIGVCIGCILMLAAPGNFVRYDTSLHQTGQQSSLFILLLNRAAASISGFYFYSFGLVFIFFVMAILSKVLKKKTKKNNCLTLPIIFFLGAVIATLAMSASPIFPGRASFGINTFIIVAISLLLGGFDYNIKTVRRFVSCLAIFGLLFYAPDYYRGHKDLTSARNILDVRLNKIRIEKQKGETDIIVEGSGIEPQTRYLHYYELRADTNDWHNEMFAKYHQLNSIKFTAE